VRLGWGVWTLVGKKTRRTPRHTGHQSRRMVMLADNRQTVKAPRNRPLHVPVPLRRVLIAWGFVQVRACARHYPPHQARIEGTGSPLTENRRIST
jgi:hypothetical protein